jgi:putative isomerase
MVESTIPLHRAWNSWTSEYPAEMSFLPLGLRLTPCAYASSINRFTLFPAGNGVALGPRAIDGSAVELTLDHGGTSLTLSYDKPDPLTLRGHWRALRLGEWGLRFWVTGNRGAGRMALRSKPRRTGSRVGRAANCDPRRAPAAARHLP